MELTFTREEIPKIQRAGGSGREPEKWEVHLTPLKESPGESARVWTYESQASAASRKTSVSTRLSKVVPNENWTIAVRPVPNTDKFGVYVVYNGTYTPEQMAENAKKHQERSERVKNARANATVTQISDGAGSPAAGSPPASTPKERVQAARSAKG